MSEFKVACDKEIERLWKLNAEAFSKSKDMSRSEYQRKSSAKQADRALERIISIKKLWIIK